MSATDQLLRSLVREVDQGRACALCTVVCTRGSTPQVPGAMLLLHADGKTEGTVGGGCVEAEVRRRALALIETRQSQLLSFDLDHDHGWDDGLICGGRLDMAVVVIAHSAGLPALREALAQMERQHHAVLPLRVRQDDRMVEYRVHIETTPTLLIAGAGHVGAAVARLAVPLDFRVVVFDDRPDCLSQERLPPPIETVAGDMAAMLRSWPIDANSYVVIVTRGHRHDEQALQAVIDRPTRYVGMIGSRRKIGRIFDDLAGLGVDRSRLDAVHAPIGLDIDAVTVPEIAVSILAELIQVRRAGQSTMVEGPLVVGEATP